MRALIYSVVLIASSVMVSQPAYAADIGLKSPGKVKEICKELGGKFWSQPDGSSYGCGYKGGGGMLCDKGGIDEDGNKVEGTCLTSTVRGREVGTWGLLGLLGLLGAIGIRGRKGVGASG